MVWVGLAASASGFVTVLELDVVLLAGASGLLLESLSSPALKPEPAISREKNAIFVIINLFHVGMVVTLIFRL
jgi:hypothetical protein